MIGLYGQYDPVGEPPKATHVTDFTSGTKTFKLHDGDHKLRGQVSYANGQVSFVGEIHCPEAKCSFNGPVCAWVPAKMPKKDTRYGQCYFTANANNPSTNSTMLSVQIAGDYSNSKDQWSVFFGVGEGNQLEQANLDMNASKTFSKTADNATGSGTVSNNIGVVTFDGSFVIGSDIRIDFKQAYVAGLYFDSEH